MQELLESILKALVSKPERVSVETQEQNHLLLFKVTVDQSDLGRVIGRNGRIVGAIRKIFLAGRAREGKTVWVEVAAASSE